ncbi:MAG: hypothetical protein CM1200mP23_1990 [Nitrososphaerota archaeon]|nr:MAG: hypothetical protein CM1200mP23_1990 [Nitrososphaerota archaeon]
MEIIDRPFQKAAENLGMTEEQVFEKLHHYEEIGVMRRYAGIFVTGKLALLPTE